MHSFHRWAREFKSFFHHFVFSLSGADRDGFVGQSSCRLIPCLQPWQQKRSFFILFLTHVKMYQSGNLWDDRQTWSVRCVSRVSSWRTPSILPYLFGQHLHRLQEIRTADVVLNSGRICDLFCVQLTELLHIFLSPVSCFVGSTGNTLLSLT